MDVVCINLKRREDRRLLMDKELATFSHSYFDAIDGNKIGGAHINLTMGEHGCMLSHLEVLKSVKQATLILEDDVHFLGTLNDIEDSVSKLPENWDILYLGVFVNDWNRTKELDDFYIANGQWGAFAYVVNEKSAKKIIDICKYKDKSYDAFLIDLHSGGNCYICKPFLVDKVDGYSDTRNENMKFISQFSCKL